eukprot:Skav216892  [mRNA]  locus=scaffold1276:124778:126628:- [translate_table: standard]
MNLEGTFNRSPKTSFISSLSRLPEFSGCLRPDLVCPHSLLQSRGLVFCQAATNHCLHGSLELPIVH